MKTLLKLSATLPALVLSVFYPSTSMAATAWIDYLTSAGDTDTGYMTPVHVVQARVQSDEPAWNEEISAFVSKYYDDAAEAFRGAMDTVNTASVEGSLMYVQAEGINYNTRSAEERCERKNGMTYVVFYDIVFAQTNETLITYDAEYGPMLPMDGGQCTPISGDGNSAVFSDTCLSINGDDGQKEIGPFVGGESKETDPRAPYPNNWWYSFPNSCPLEKWGDKTEECRASTRQGLCDMNVLPDGVNCTYNYRILGYVAIDDLVGITSMTNNDTGKTYSNFTEFCEAGGVEFKASEAGVWEESIDFWLKPQDETANVQRAAKLVDFYASVVNGSFTSTQIDPEKVANMQPLPTIDELTAENPPCYRNVENCNGEFGCKRSLFGQLCTTCSSADDASCVPPKAGFTFPKIIAAESSDSGSSSSGSITVSDSGSGNAGVDTSGSTNEPNKSTEAPSASSSNSASSATMSISTMFVAILSLLGLHSL